MRTSNMAWGAGMSNQMGWFYMVMVYEGLSNGITIYINGVLVVSITSGTSVTHGAAVGKTVLGRFYTDQDEKYATIKVDEVTLWNVALTAQDVQDLYNFYGNH